MTRLGLMVLVTAALTICGALSADTLYLQDGRTIQGKVTSAKDAPVVTIETPMGPLEFRASMVKQIKLGEQGPAAHPTAVAPTTPTATPGAGTQPEAILPPSSAGKADPAFQAKLAEATKALEKATTGAEGLAILDALLKDCPPGPTADSVRARMEPWKEKADKNLVRFGPTQWLAKDQVDARRAEADKLVGQADAESKTDEAAKLYDKASGQDPFRADIPMKKAMRFYKDKNMAKYGMALGDVVKIDPANVSARNNQGVIQAQQKQWGGAMMNISKAALLAEDIDKIMDNLAEVQAMAADDDGPGKIARADSERTIQVVVAQLHNAKKHIGDNRWGNTWVKEDEYQKNLKTNADLDKDVIVKKKGFEAMKQQFATLTAQKTQWQNALNVAQGAGSVGGVGYGGGYVDPNYISTLTTNIQNATTSLTTMETAGKKAQDDIKGDEGKKLVQPAPGKLILLDADGKAELETISIDAAKPADKPAGR